MERGASSWLSALPLEHYGFALHKGEFIDAVCLRYGFTPSLLPSHCVCVVRILPWLTPLASHMVPFQLSGIMKYEIWLLVWWQKCAMMSRWSLNYMPCLVRLCITVQLCLKIMQEWILEHLVFGGAYIIASFWCSRFTFFCSLQSVYHIGCHFS